MTDITRSSDGSYEIAGLHLPVIAKLVPDYDPLEAALEALEDHGYLFATDAPGWTAVIDTIDWSIDPDSTVATVTATPPALERDEPDFERDFDGSLADRDANRYEAELNRMAP